MSEKEQKGDRLQKTQQKGTWGCQLTAGSTQGSSVSWQPRVHAAFWGVLNTAWPAERGDSLTIPNIGAASS